MRVQKKKIWGEVLGFELLYDNIFLKFSGHVGFYSQRSGSDKHSKMIGFIEWRAIADFSKISPCQHQLWGREKERQGTGVSWMGPVLTLEGKPVISAEVGRFWTVGVDTDCPSPS